MGWFNHRLEKAWHQKQNEVVWSPGGGKVSSKPRGYPILFQTKMSQKNGSYAGRIVPGIVSS